MGAEREDWLAALPAADRVHEVRLREMLASQARADVDEPLASLPRLSRDDEVARTGEMIGPCRLLREIGRGGMGSVWLAERADGSFSRQVALKLPRLAWGAGLAERMAREREIGMLLEHPAIARLYDAGLDERGRPYLALEYIEGQPLDVWCEAQALEVPARLRLFLQVVRAVAYAHGRLVVHRDLKPSNVLVSADGQAHLLDFGIAKLLTDAAPGEPGLTQQQGRVLTPHYAAPEQLRGEAITVASDVYSLGVLLYVLLTGKLTHAPERGSLAALEEAILSGEPDPASSRAVDKAAAKALRGEIDAILTKALRREPAQRYATADALAQDIERHLRGDVVLAQPDRLGYRLRKALRRHRVGFAAGAAIGLTVLVGAGVSIVQGQRASNEADRARVVKEFVVDAFRINERGNAGNDETRQLPVELLLERGAKLIDIKFAGRHDLQSELYGVVARILLDMKADPLALEYARKHVAALTAAGSSDDRQAQCSLLLGEALRANLKNDDAEGAARRALASARHPELKIEARLLLADLTRRSDRYEAALAELEQVDLALRQNPTLPRALVAKSHYLRARVLVSTNHFDQARPLFERAIDEALAAEGQTSRLASKIRFSLANQLASAGFVEPSRAMFKEVLAAMRAVGGEDDLESALLEVDAVSTLAANNSMGFDEANAAMTKTLTTLERQGSRIPRWVRADVESSLSCLALRFGRVQQGYELAVRSVPVLRAADQLPIVEGCLGWGMMMIGRHDEAEIEMKRDVDLSRGVDCCAAHAHVALAKNRMMAGRLAQAREALATAPSFPSRKGASQAKADWAAMSVRVAQAQLEVESGKPAEALRLLEGVADGKYMMHDAGFIRGEALCGLGRAAKRCH